LLQRVVAKPGMAQDLLREQIETTSPTHD
jgi:hypothetical protein